MNEMMVLEPADLEAIATWPTCVDPEESNLALSIGRDGTKEFYLGVASCAALSVKMLRHAAATADDAGDAKEFRALTVVECAVMVIAARRWVELSTKRRR